MTGDAGTIVEFDLMDALGFIELDSGERVRFGGTSMKGFGGEAWVGMRVEVRGTKPGYKGVPKAIEVWPLATAEASPASSPDAAPPEHPSTPWPDFVAEHPRFSDALDTCVPCAHPAAPIVLPENALFAPWQREICESSPTCVDLHIPNYMRPEDIDPGSHDSFALGRVAYLDQPRWPSCGVCSRPLEMCVQLSPAVMRDFMPGGHGLVALFCFHCGVRERGDSRVGHVRMVDGKFRVAGPEDHQSASSGWRPATQRVTPSAPSAMAPASTWLRHRSERSPTTAGSALFGFDPPPVTGPFPAGVDDACLDDLGAQYDDWLAERAARSVWGGARLGGVASWDQADETPSCAHSEMLLLLDYEGGQFLDGALHVFSCREQSCDLQFVAEF